MVAVAVVVAVAVEVAVPVVVAVAVAVTVVVKVAVVVVVVAVAVIGGVRPITTRCLRLTVHLPIYFPYANFCCQLACTCPVSPLTT